MRRTTSTVSAPSDQAGLRAVGRVNFACVSFARGHTATARVLCVTDWPLARAPCVRRPDPTAGDYDSKARHGVESGVGEWIPAYTCL